MKERTMSTLGAMIVGLLAIAFAVAFAMALTEATKELQVSRVLGIIFVPAIVGAIVAGLYAYSSPAGKGNAQSWSELPKGKALGVEGRIDGFDLQTTWLLVRTNYGLVFYKFDVRLAEKVDRGTTFVIHHRKEDLLHVHAQLGVHCLLVETLRDQDPKSSSSSPAPAPRTV